MSQKTEASRRQPIRGKLKGAGLKVGMDERIIYVTRGVKTWSRRFLRVAETFLLLLRAEREGVLLLSGDAKPLRHVLRRDAAEQTRLS